MRCLNVTPRPGVSRVGHSAGRDGKSPESVRVEALMVVVELMVKFPLVAARISGGKLN